MKPSRVKGLPVLLTCDGCTHRGYAGDETFTAASGGIIEPEAWYFIGIKFYCSTCSARITEYEDPTRSKTAFFSDVKGESWDR